MIKGLASLLLSVVGCAAPWACDALPLLSALQATIWEACAQADMHHRTGSWKGMCMDIV